MTVHDFDVVIVGGGLVGCSLACALAPLGLRVGLVDQPLGRAQGLAQDQRKLALAAASVRALSALGVMARLKTAPTAIRRIHVSRQGDLGAVRLQASEFGREDLGAVVLAGDLGAALQATVAALPQNVRSREGQATLLEGADDRRRLRIESPQGDEVWNAALLVAADGTASPLRQALGIGAEVFDYAQTLIVTSLRTSQAPDGTAFERFTDTGPCALLPMAGGRYGALCGVATDDAERVLALDAADYAAFFQQRFGWRAGRVLEVGERFAWPLRRIVAERVVAERAVLMGNAAQTIHPIGAQGFNLGLRDALTLADVLGERGGDAGAPSTLTEYEGRRREDREQTLAFSDGLARMTRGTTFLHHLGRSVGLLAMSLDSGLRAQLAAGAMGYRGRVPRLAREPA